MKYIVTMSGRVSVDIEIEAASPHEAVRLARELELGRTRAAIVRPDSVDESSEDPSAGSWDVVAACEDCGTEILSGDRYASDPEEGTYACKACLEAMKRG